MTGAPLLIPEPPLQVLPSLAADVGVNEAIVLQQIHYWSLMRVRQGEDGWVYNTHDAWLKQFPWLTLRTFERVIKRLREKELVLTRQPEGTNRRTHYRVGYDKLPCSDAAILAGSSRHIGGLTSTSTETSTEKTPCNPPTNPGEQEPSDPPPPPAAVSSPLTAEIQIVWSHYVAVMKPRGRGRELQPDDRKIIRDALKVGDVDELKLAIDTCERSDFHMKRGKHKTRPGGKYKAIGKIFKPRSSKGETWRSRLEWWIELAEASACMGTVTFDVNAEAERMRREQGLEP